MAFLSTTKPQPKMTATGKPPENRKPKLSICQTKKRLAAMRTGLAGANRRPTQCLDQQDDGILTGWKSLATDLRGTEIVVQRLPDGQRHRSAGREWPSATSFQLAGGRSVMATLWNIPDAETAELMTYFWHSMSAKTTSRKHYETLNSQ